jgi:hypothetical protein
VMLMKKLREFLKASSRIHVRGAEVGSLGEVVGLIDRFIDGRLRFVLEWDDFVSWENSNPGIEKVRARICALEGDFFSPAAEVRRSALNRLIVIRNETAEILGLPRRD